MTGKNKKILLIAYLLLAGLVFLYLRFPGNAVKQHIVNRIRQAVPDVQVSIGSLRLGFPLALRLGRIDISRNERLLFSFDRIRLSPVWHSLFSARKAIAFEASAYQGVISGTMTQPAGKHHRGAVTGVFSGIRL